MKHFEGPLDLLLDEVRRQNVEIEDVALAPMVARFLDYVRSAASRNLNLDIEWLHMAATLIHWKSLSLLPSRQTKELDEIRESVVRQLVAAAAELGRRQGMEAARHSRPVEATEEVEAAAVFSVWDMIQEARGLAVWVDRYRQARAEVQDFGVEPDEVTVAEMMRYLEGELARGERLEAGALIGRQQGGSRKACLFLGILEMARTRQVVLDQQEAFGPLWMKPAAGQLPTVGVKDMGSP